MNRDELDELIARHGTILTAIAGSLERIAHAGEAPKVDSELYGFGLALRVAGSDLSRRVEEARHE